MRHRKKDEENIRFKAELLNTIGQAVYSYQYGWHYKFLEQGC